MDSNLPVTTDQPAAPALPAVAADPYAGGESHWAQRPRQRQNIATGLFPLALGVLLLLFFGLAFWTLVTATGGGL